MQNTDRCSLPDEAGARNRMPMADGLLYYFPNALAAVAEVSRIGNAQHNPGEPMHWSRGKSTDHANKILRHLVDAGKRDGKGVRHSAYMAWRALALLQEEIERDEGAPLPRNARFDEEPERTQESAEPMRNTTSESHRRSSVRENLAQAPRIKQHRGRVGKRIGGG